MTKNLNIYISIYMYNPVNVIGENFFTFNLNTKEIYSYNLTFTNNNKKAQQRFRDLKFILFRANDPVFKVNKKLCTYCRVIKCNFLYIYMCIYDAI